MAVFGLKKDSKTVVAQNICSWEKKIKKINLHLSIHT